MSSLSVDLHKISKFVNVGIPAGAVGFFFLGNTVSFYFHYLTIALLIMTVMNVFYLYVQREHAILRNFGLMGQARYIIESLGPEIRQYLISSDTEERPFNRLERAEVYRKSKGIDSASSFGSQMNFDGEEIKLRHSMYPVDKDDVIPFSVTYGEARGLASAYTIHRPIMISAMSYGALGSNAVRALARGARLAGIPMNTGEGGWPKYPLMEGCDLIFQMGTAKFGVRQEDGRLDDQRFAELCAEPAIKMVEIKLSQGAKPGKGGLLPKEKISAEIAELRGVGRDRDVVSPPHHKECTDAASTVAFIRHVQEVGGKPTGIKLCLGSFEEFAELVQAMKRQNVFPDFITIDGAEGGTGAAPKAFMDTLGVPLFPALRAVSQILEEAGVRDRLKLNASGKLINSGRQLVALALGADAIYSARGFMLSMGCIQALQCGNNTCPVGITTHDPSLTKGLVIPDKAQRVANYVKNIEHDIEELLRAAGVRQSRDLSVKHLYIPADSSVGAMPPVPTL